ncbi:hypothetical protein GFY24_14715 [Nocardia sp. SYP-A9097]|uniref:hypothetical protein n=1 Tax=Nocardia sp. SYP-A9097 TaxID=2663237 RepID=UPI00129C105A|nr:hypothetical protein [Nocardia sp. SYP-A9097]
MRSRLLRLPIRTGLSLSVLARLLPIAILAGLLPASSGVRLPRTPIRLSGNVARLFRPGRARLGAAGKLSSPAYLPRHRVAGLLSGATIHLPGLTAARLLRGTPNGLPRITVHAWKLIRDRAGCTLRGRVIARRGSAG